MSELAADLTSALKGVTKQWKKEKDGRDRMSRTGLGRMRIRVRETSIKEAAWRVMEEAYNHASSGGRYRANARQIMYAARPLILQLTNGRIWKSSSYFTQTLLKDYLERCEPDWKIVWDARGHFHEPHTGHSLDLGGAAVAHYIGGWTGEDFDPTPESTIDPQIDTKGPSLRYNAALFIEKEGFDEILRDAGIAERYDLAIFSSKGIPVAAACRVARALHAQGVKIMVIHDFDLAGFKIVRTMRRGTRLTKGAPMVDIGLRLADVEGLESEPVQYKQAKNPREYLSLCGATQEEGAYLVQGRGYGGWYGQRVELNAMTSEQFINFLEGKLQEHGISKVVPGHETLEKAYRRAFFRDRLTQEARKLAEHLPTIDAPNDLQASVGAWLDRHPGASWDEAVVGVMREAAHDEP